MTTLFIGFGKKEIVIASDTGGTAHYPDGRSIPTEGQEKIFGVRPYILVAGAGSAHVIQNAVRNLPPEIDLTSTTTAGALSNYCEKLEEHPNFYIAGVENNSFIAIDVSSNKKTYTVRIEIQEKPDHYYIACHPPKDRLTEWPENKFKTWAVTHLSRGASPRKLAQITVELLGEGSKCANRIPNIWVIPRGGRAQRIK